jgi:hypothetical protein
LKTITSTAASQENLLEQRKDAVFDRRVKRTRARSQKHDVSLTCSEAQVEAILSEGESTEKS